MNLNKKIDVLINNEQYFHHYQPLFNLENNTLIGFEILFRSNLYSPELAFSEAKKSGRLFELETKSIHKALCSEDVNKLDRTSLFFINFFPSTLVKPTFLKFLRETINNAKLKPDQIVIEINDDEVIADFSVFVKCIEEFKKIEF